MNEKVAASLLFGDKLKSIRGIELLEDLCQISTTAIQSYIDLINSLEYSDLYESRRGCSLIATEGDFLNPTAIAEWTKSDIVFANSTCFDAELMQLIATHATCMSHGSRFITFTSQLPSDAFTVREKINLGMSWGVATCYIHIRYTLFFLFWPSKTNEISNPALQEVITIFPANTVSTFSLRRS